MTTVERHETRPTRPKRKWRDSLWAVGLIALIVGVAVRLVMNGMSAWPSAVVGAVGFAAWWVFLIRRRRKHDARLTGAPQNDIPGLERQILKGKEPPQDQEQRHELAVLVDSRQRKLRRNRWWALPLLAVIFFGTAALMFATSSATAGGLYLAFAIVFMGWMTWYHFHHDRRLTQMRQRLQG
ncbi:hypothetical protein ACGFZL_11670 [Streptomyces sp. NPDC048182]|uniref:hypothetical protein n=1 Tax=Streptomyces sp. NPDC048182 TaxID=3365507 RepID=UPI003714F49D